MKLTSVFIKVFWGHNNGRNRKESAMTDVLLQGLSVFRQEKHQGKADTKKHGAEAARNCSDTINA